MDRRDAWGPKGQLSRSSAECAPRRWGTQTSHLPPELQEELLFLAVTQGNLPRELFTSSGPQGVFRQPLGAPRVERARRGGGEWGGLLGTESVTPGALCPRVRYVAHGILNKAYRKVLEQLSARKYLQTLVVKGPG